MADASYGAYQLNLKAGSDLLNIAANDADELRARADALFGEGTGKELIAKFFTVAMLSGSTTSTPTPTEPASSAPAPQGAETCPECGKGQLVIKQRKDGSGTFRGCNRFREGCRYIAKGR